MKVCSECGQEKPLSEFNKLRKSKDGHQDRCRECFSKYNKARYHIDPTRFKSDVKKYREENLENVFSTRLSMCEKNPSEKNAREAVTLAVRLGYLSKPDHCFGCGCPDEESMVTAHHHDYMKPLEVTWVCSRCHRQLDANRRLREGKLPFGREKRVVMLVDGKPACRFDSVVEAAKAIGRKSNSISQCLSGKTKTCGGFEWQYEEIEDGA